MSDRHVDFLKAYDRYRVEDQIAFYERRVDEYARSAKQAGRLTSLLVALAAACGAIGAIYTEQNRWLGLVAAGLSAVAAAVSAWSDTIGFDANAELYRAALGGLRRLRPKRPVVDDATDVDIERYVTQVEGILLGEVRSWAERWTEPPAADGSDPTPSPGPPTEA